MTDKEFRDNVINYLLGKNFYIVDPVNNEQANDIIFDYIKRDYAPRNLNLTEIYRTKHKKCKWCKYYEYVIPKVPCAPDYQKCNLKDKIIKNTNLRTRCKWYRLEKVYENN